MGLSDENDEELVENENMKDANKYRSGERRGRRRRRWWRK